MNLMKKRQKNINLKVHKITMKKLKKQVKGITLIALVVTVIVLLILAGVAISLTVGDNGLFKRAQNAAETYEQSGDIEKINLALADALIKNNGNAPSKDNLEIALLEDGTKSLVVDNEDGTRDVIFLDKKKIYKINNDGSIVDTNSDFDSIYVAPDSQDEERNEGVIGIGTDGKPVDMDLWEYTLMENDDAVGMTKQTYGLNDIDALDLTGNSGRSAGYLGGYTEEGTIIGTIPAYISVDGGNTYTEVTTLGHTFFDCDNLIIAPEIPSTITDMSVTFYKCSNLVTASNVPGLVTSIAYTFCECEQLKAMPIIKGNVINFEGCFSECTSLTAITTLPESITNMAISFSGCTSLKSAPELPTNAINLRGTFANCTSLKEAPLIPNKVENMQSTFQGCIQLVTPPSLIPLSVKNLECTFTYCENISGSMRIDAEPERYALCFASAATSQGVQLRITGNSSLLESIINTKSANSNIN